MLECGEQWALMTSGTSEGIVGIYSWCGLQPAPLSHPAHRQKATPNSLSLRQAPYCNDAIEGSSLCPTLALLVRTTYVDGLHGTQLSPPLPLLSRAPTSLASRSCLGLRVAALSVCGGIASGKKQRHPPARSFREMRLIPRR
jgi:hypothetical protein